MAGIEVATGELVKKVIMEDEKDFTAVYVSSWAGEFVYMCEKHMAGMKNIANAMGVPMKVQLYFGHEQCKNCINDAKKQSLIF
jgi:hypothetical protein